MDGWIYLQEQYEDISSNNFANPNQAEWFVVELQVVVLLGRFDRLTSVIIRLTVYFPICINALEYIYRRKKQEGEKTGNVQRRAYFSFGTSFVQH